MPLVFSAICPHPPIIIPQIGQENIRLVDQTISALLNLEKKLVAQKPEIIILVSPHSPLIPDKFICLNGDYLKGDFAQFGHPEVSLEFKTNRQLIQEIKKEFGSLIEIVPEADLDHGALVPLFYLTSGKLNNLNLILLGFSFLPLDVHFNFGRRLGKIIKESNKRIAFIASGDLSHRLNREAPAGYSPYGLKFDQKLIDLLKNKKTKEIINMDPYLIEEAGECGLKSIIIALGIISGLNYQTEILSYEGPFGVGYLVANFKLIN